MEVSDFDETVLYISERLRIDKALKLSEWLLNEVFTNAVEMSASRRTFSLYGIHGGA